MISTEIEIASSPEDVRNTFLAFSKYPEWTPRFIKSIDVVPKKDTIEKGDTLHCVLEGMTFDPTVLENSSREFRWRGSAYGLFVGEHSFRFEPSKTKPGSTTLIQSEDFSGVLAFFMSPIFGWDKKTQVGFESFNQDLKARVESRKGSP